MSSWVEKGRPAIFEALQTVCNQIDRDLSSELAHRDKELEACSAARAVDRQVLESNQSLIQYLTEENSKLRAQVADLNSQLSKKPSDDDQRPDPARPGLSYSAADSPAPEQEFEEPVRPTPSDVDKGQDWKAECTRVRKKFDALDRNFKTAKEALQKRKEERESWMKYADSLEAKIKTAETKHQIVIIQRNKHNNLPSTGNHQNGQGSDAELQNGGDDPLLPDPSSIGDEAGAIQSDGIGSTQDGSDEKSQELPQLSLANHSPLEAIKREPSSDLPCVISERVVRKRKVQDTAPEESPVRRIKAEPLDDGSPIVASETRSTQDSIDLDEVGQRLLTPRKRKEFEITQSEVEARGRAVSSVKTPSFYMRSDHASRAVRPTLPTSALTPLSVNRRLLKSSSSKSKTRLRKEALAHGISSLADDGDNYEGTSTSPSTPQASRATHAATNSRLGQLLNTSTPSLESTIPRLAKSNRRAYQVDEEAIPERRRLPFDKSEKQANRHQRQQGPETPVPSLNEFKIPPRNVSPRRSRTEVASLLRNKPSSELRLEDFKVNPAVNDGHDFAFSEVVRNKDERACLPGCTDMHCCGKEFRALALSQRPDPPLTAIQRHEEQKLLEGYLGDYAYRLAGMDKYRRAELWVEAKTQELANKYGKHRHRYSRMRSPPGFWNADFPSTQELEADKAEAGAREKGMIGERYREAMRPGGRWLFRDE